MDTIQIRRGKKSLLPLLSDGEFGYCSDSKELYIGTGKENIFLCRADFDEEIRQVRLSLRQAMEEVTKAQADIGQAKETLGDIQGEVSAQQSRLNTAEGDIGELKTKNTAITDELAAGKSALAQVQTNLDNTAGQLNTLAGQVSSLEAQASAAATALGQLQSDMKDTGTAVSGLKTQMTELDLEIAAAKTALESANTALLDIQKSVEQVKGELMTLAAVAKSGDYLDLINRPASLPANGGNADTVNGHRVNSDVPEGARFTDTIVSKVSELENDRGYLAADQLRAGENITITSAENGLTISASGASGGTAAIVDDLTSTSTDAALSANMGRELAEGLAGKIGEVEQAMTASQQGYLEFSNGFRMEWGILLMTGDANTIAKQKIVFTKRFARAPGVMICSNHAFPGEQVEEVGFANATAANMNAVVYKKTTDPCFISWLAVGPVRQA